MAKRPAKTAKTTKTTKTRSRAKIAARAGYVALAALLALILWMRVEARVVRLQTADVRVRDLPAAFENVKVLYLSDIHVDAITHADEFDRLLSQLWACEPDMLLLGGDYVSNVEDEAVARERLAAFFGVLSRYEAPLGKYASLGNHETRLSTLLGESLSGYAAMGGVTLLDDEAATAKRGDGELRIVGVTYREIDKADGAVTAAKLVKSADCAIVLTHDPDLLPMFNNQPAEDGGAWVDLALAGHTHGGQVWPVGPWLQARRSYYGARFLSGWYVENGVPMLVSNGVGSTPPLRLGVPAQAHLLTLHQKVTEG